MKLEKPTRVGVLNEARVLVQIRLRRGKTLPQATTYAALYWLPEWQQVIAATMPGAATPTWPSFRRAVQNDWQLEGPFEKPPLPDAGQPRKLLRGGNSSKLSVIDMNRIIRLALEEDWGNVRGIIGLGKNVAKSLGFSESEAVNVIRNFTTAEEWNYLRGRYAAHIRSTDEVWRWQRITWPLVLENLARRPSWYQLCNAIETEVGVGHIDLHINQYATPEQLHIIGERFPGVLKARRASAGAEPSHQAPA